MYSSLLDLGWWIIHYLGSYQYHSREKDRHSNQKLTLSRFTGHSEFTRIAMYNPSLRKDFINNMATLDSEVGDSLSFTGRGWEREGERIFWNNTTYLMDGQIYQVLNGKPLLLYYGEKCQTSFGLQKLTLVWWVCREYSIQVVGLIFRSIFTFPKAHFF